MTWIDEEEQLLKLENVLSKEKIEEVKCVFLFINSERMIEKITQDTAKLKSTYDGESTHLLASDLLQLIQEQKTMIQNSRYMYKDLLLFHVNNSSDELNEFLYNTNIYIGDPPFFNKLPLMEDVDFDQSLFIFHQMSSLYFIFEEEKEIPKELTIPKPILKLNTSTQDKSSGDKKTKRVSIKINNNHYTRKNS